MTKVGDGLSGRLLLFLGLLLLLFLVLLMLVGESFCDVLLVGIGRCLDAGFVGVFMEVS